MAEETAKTTRYLIFETEDEGATLLLVGVKESESSENAARAWFAGLADDRAGDFIAVSENSCKIRRRSVETTTKVSVTVLGPPRLLVDTEPEAPAPLALAVDPPPADEDERVETIAV